MWPPPDYYVQEVFLANQRVGPGIYRQVGSKTEIVLAEPDRLPASHDGRIACYVRVDLHRLPSPVPSR